MTLYDMLSRAIDDVWREAKRRGYPMGSVLEVRTEEAGLVRIETGREERRYG